mgnify:CR=1 FL=1
MGSGASSSYDASSQAALMGEMRASYETLAAQSSNLSDIELYSEMQAKYVEITTINNDGNLVNGVIKDKIPQLTDIAPTKHPSPILRMDSVAGEIVEKVEESGIDDEDDEGIDTTFNTGAATLGTASGSCCKSASIHNIHSYFAFSILLGFTSTASILVDVSSNMTTSTPILFNSVNFVPI